MLRKRKFANRSKKIKITGYLNDLAGNLQLYSKHEINCDVVITSVDNVLLHAHEAILSASDFNILNWLTVNEETGVYHSEFDATTLKVILEVVYTGRTELNSGIVENVLKAAHSYKMNQLVDVCWDFLKDEIDSNNCLCIPSIALKYGSFKVAREARLYRNKHFERVCTEEEFLELNETELTEIVSSGHFNCTEDVVLQGLISWVEYDKTNREKHIFDILNSRTEFIVNDILKKVAYLKKNEWTVEILNRDLKTWSSESLPPPLHPRKNYSVTGAYNNIFIVGGMIDDVATNKVESLDLSTKAWVELPPMSIPRIAPEVFISHGNLYVVAGHDKENSMEIYNFSTKSWEEVKLDFQPRRVYVDDGFLYGALRPPDFKIKYYDVAGKYSTFLDCAVAKSLELEMAVLEGRLYLPLDNLYYDLLECKWYGMATSIMDQWTIIKCLTVNRRLIVCARERNSYCIFEYDPPGDIWSSVSTFLKTDDILFFSI